jgi:hypothetical protein
METLKSSPIPAERLAATARLSKPAPTNSPARLRTFPTLTWFCNAWMNSTYPIDPPSSFIRPLQDRGFHFVNFSQIDAGQGFRGEFDLARETRKVHDGDHRAGRRREQQILAFFGGRDFVNRIRTIRAPKSTPPASSLRMPTSDPIAS